MGKRSRVLRDSLELVLAPFPFLDGILGRIIGVGSVAAVILLLHSKWSGRFALAIAVLLAALCFWAVLRLQWRVTSGPVLVFQTAFSTRTVMRRELPTDSEGLIGAPRDVLLPDKTAFFGGAVKNDPPDRQSEARAHACHLRLRVSNEATRAEVIAETELRWLNIENPAFTTPAELIPPRERDLEPNGRAHLFPLGYLFGDEPGSFYVARGDANEALTRKPAVRLGPGSYRFTVIVGGVGLRDTPAEYLLTVAEPIGDTGSATLHLVGGENA
jgi:hypothetical protein